MENVGISMAYLGIAMEYVAKSMEDIGLSMGYLGISMEYVGE